MAFFYDKCTIVGQDLSLDGFYVPVLEQSFVKGKITNDQKQMSIHTQPNWLPRFKIS